MMYAYARDELHTETPDGLLARWREYSSAAVFGLRSFVSVSCIIPRVRAIRLAKRISGHDNDLSSFFHVRHVCGCPFLSARMYIIARKEKP